jgi:hypothetical protein
VLRYVNLAQDRDQVAYFCEHDDGHSFREEISCYTTKLSVQLMFVERGALGWGESSGNKKE